MVTLAMGTWNVTLLRGKEPELVREVERYQLEIVGLPPRTAWAMEPNSLREAGLFSSLELPTVRVTNWCGLAHSSPAQLSVKQLG